MKAYKVFCPLINFQIVVEPKLKDLSEKERTDLRERLEKQLVEGVEIYEGVRIRRRSGVDVEDIMLDSSIPMPKEVAETCSFVLEKCFVSEHEIDRFMGVMRDIVLGLRLLKRGYVSGSDVFCIVVSEKRLLYYHMFSRRRQWPGAAYVLSLDALPVLGKLIKAVEGVDFNRQRSLHLALRRFESGLEEELSEDQLIDFWIAFEALFLGGGDIKGPAGHIIEVASSVLLGKSDRERKEIRQQLATAYSTRNGIVHGSKHPFTDKPYELDDFVPKIEDYLRESIKRFLDQD